MDTGNQFQTILKLCSYKGKMLGTLKYMAGMFLKYIEKDKITNRGAMVWYCTSIGVLYYI